MVKEIDPCEQLDEEVEDLLLQLIDDFVNSTVNTACVFAKHRNANSVEVKDVQLYLGIYKPIRVIKNILKFNYFHLVFKYYDNLLILLIMKTLSFSKISTF